MTSKLIQEIEYALKTLEREERIEKLWVQLTKKKLKRMKRLALN